MITRNGEALFEALPTMDFSGLYGQEYTNPDGRPSYTHLGLDMRHAYREYATGLYGTRVPFTNNGSFGDGLCIDTGVGVWRYRLFAHNDRVLIPMGGKVTPKMPAAISGASGYTFGAHIHLQVARNTQFIPSLAETRNPLDFLATPQELEEPMTTAEKGLINYASGEYGRMNAAYVKLASAGFLDPNGGDDDLNGAVVRRFRLIELASSLDADAAWEALGK